MYKEVKVQFALVSAKYGTQWEIQLQLNSGIFGGPRNNTLVVGTVHVRDDRGEMTPNTAYEAAVEQVLKGDVNWRPILSHDQER